jgi:hypothetical protein
MPIVSGDIVYRLSGGAGNSSPDASLGGAKSSTVMGTNIFDNVSSGEAAAGDVEYRAAVIANAHIYLAGVERNDVIDLARVVSIDVGVGIAAQA